VNPARLRTRAHVFATSGSSSMIKMRSANIVASLTHGEKCFSVLLESVQSSLQYRHLVGKNEARSAIVEPHE